MAGTEKTMYNNDRVQQLEHKYIELLEKRIASLEALVKRSETVTSKDAESAGCPKADEGTYNEKIQSDSGQLPMTRLRERVLIDEGVPEEKDIDPSEFEFLDRQPPEEKAEPRERTYKLTWYRVLSEKRKYKYSEFDVNSPELQALLRVALSHYPRLHFPSDGVHDSINFKSPFIHLIHNWDKLEALTEDDSAEYRDLRTKAQAFGSGENREVTHLASSLVQLAKDEHLEEARNQLREMLSRVRNTPELRSYFNSLDRDTKARSVQFDYLWTIFPPGEVVYSTVFLREPQLFIVKGGYESSDSERDKKRVWKLICWSYDWNGRTFNRVPVKFCFEEFQGFRATETLIAYPLKIMPKESIDKLVVQLRRRGERFRDLCTKKRGEQMFDYEGEAITHGAGFQKLGNRRNDDRDDRPGGLLSYSIFGIRRRILPQPPASKSQKIDGRVMVDFGAYLQHAPHSSSLAPIGDAALSGKDEECRCSTCSSNEDLKENQKTYWDDVPPNKEFADLQLQLCPPRVLGYHLQKKTWMELNIALDEKREEKGKFLKDIQQKASREAFSKLQLVPSQKRLVQDLVESHAREAMNMPLMEDIMKGKGKGLVILLHGPPGVGKTLTAESVAQLAGKPLFSVGVADIGLNPEDVERNLEALFELAANWRAVLLFDEADVFLESRSAHTSDLNRNALVSVLLRVLEYYDGILILTTNRIRQFDIAVQSRVNLGIKYGDLEKDQKLNIIKSFLGQLSAENLESQDKIMEWIDEEEEGREQIKPLNGRQIRNILFSAASLAMKDNTPLKLDHVRKMMRATFLFHDSIKTVVEEARDRAEARRT